MLPDRGPTMSSPSPDTYRELALERERRAAEPGWCCNVVGPNGATIAALYDLSRGTVDETIVDAVHSFPILPRSGEYIRVELWRLPAEFRR